MCYEFFFSVFVNCRGLPLIFGLIRQFRPRFSVVVVVVMLIVHELIPLVANILHRRTVKHTNTYRNILNRVHELHFGLSFGVTVFFLFSMCLSNSKEEKKRNQHQFASYGV